SPNSTKRFCVSVMIVSLPRQGCRPGNPDALLQEQFPEAIEIFDCRACFAIALDRVLILWPLLAKQQVGSPERSLLGQASDLPRWIGPADGVQLDAAFLRPLDQLAFEDLAAGGQRKRSHRNEIFVHAV